MAPRVTTPAKVDVDRDGNRCDRTCEPELCKVHRTELVTDDGRILVGSEAVEYALAYMARVRG
jgi:hypothetical protein